MEGFSSVRCCMRYVLRFTSLTSLCPDSILGSDGVGTVVEPKSHPLYNKSVLIAPSVGWLSSPDGPDQPDEPHGILGGTKPTQGRGTFAEFIVVKDREVIALPAHLEGSWAEAASLPLGGLTAWRAVFTKAGVKQGQNVLITGTVLDYVPVCYISFLAYQACARSKASVVVWPSKLCNLQLRQVCISPLVFLKTSHYD
jgi:hypothetical protein